MKFPPSRLPALNTFKLILAAGFLASPSFHALAEVSEESESGQRTQEQIEEGTRLQIFLDRAKFSPGKIDGRPGDFTTKAIAFYREAHGGESAPAAVSAAVDPDTMPDVSDLDLASVDPVFIDYTVQEVDLENVGNLPDDVAEKAKKKVLPYASVLEAIAEKFHADQGFIEKLNEGRTGDIKVGDTLRVPNVEPFDLAAFKKAQEETESEKTDDAEESEKDAADPAEATAAEEEATTSVLINSTTNMLTVRENDKLVAAYPVTIGSGQTESPVGDWKITGIAKLPDFRYDESMLKRGVRSDDFHILPPGPNNPVGVVWIQLNKTGIGVHGTNDPDSIGRSASAGCVRLANWDVVRLLEKIEQGVSVKIQ